jgi:hypothetical protein
MDESIQYAQFTLRRAGFFPSVAAAAWIHARASFTADDVRRQPSPERPMQVNAALVREVTASLAAVDNRTVGHWRWLWHAPERVLMLSLLYSTDLSRQRTRVYYVVGIQQQQ